jgi:hypothetical protein
LKRDKSVLKCQSKELNKRHGIEEVSEDATVDRNNFKSCKYEGLWNGKSSQAFAKMFALMFQKLVR